MNKSLIWVAFFVFGLFSKSDAQDLGLFIHGAYSYPFCNNEYISPESQSGGAVAFGFFNQLNDHWEVVSQLGVTNVRFTDVDYYYYDPYGGTFGTPIANFYKGGIDLLATQLEFQARYFVKDHKLGVGLGLFGGWYGEGSGVNNNFASATVTNGYLEANGLLNSGAKTHNIHFAENGLFGPIFGIFYEPIPRLQLFLRYDMNLLNIWPEATDAIGKNKFQMLKAGLEVRLIKDYTKTRY